MKMIAVFMLIMGSISVWQHSTYEQRPKRSIASEVTKPGPLFAPVSARVPLDKNKICRYDYQSLKTGSHNRLYQGCAPATLFQVKVTP